MIHCQVKFNAKAYNNRSNLQQVIETLQKVKKLIGGKYPSDTTMVYVCADTPNNCLWVCCPDYEYQILLD